jgi:hypothetical protein
MNVPTSDLLAALAGGLTIGVASSFMLIFSGRIAGISGIVGGLIPPTSGDSDWRFTFLLGLLIGGVALRLVYPAAFPTEISTSTLGLVAAGLLVGFGTRLGNGCTSGHGVCGIGRTSRRSLVATMVFLTTGMITVFFTHHVFGAA